MKRTILFSLFALSLSAATRYVSSTGVDTNDGTTLATGGGHGPWLSIDHAINNLGCGGTLIVDANDDWSQATLPTPAYIPSCTKKSHIRTSRFNDLPRNGIRIDPWNKDKHKLGKIQIQQGGGTAFTAAAEAHGSGLTMGGGFFCTMLSITGGDTFGTSCSIGNNSSGIPGLANGLQVDLQIMQAGTGNHTMPTGLTHLTKYLIAGCTNCGAPNETFKLTTLGGTPISGVSCSGTCALADWLTASTSSGGIIVDLPIQVNLATSTFTAVDTTVTAGWTNGKPVSAASTAWAKYGSLPGGLGRDTGYFLCGVSGQSTQLCSDQAGSHLINLTDVGTGPLLMSINQVSSHWVFEGLEISIKNDVDGVYGLLTFGDGAAASAILGTPEDFEVSHCYIHQLAGSHGTASKGIFTNARHVKIHDSVVIGFTRAEAQAINGVASPGPVWIINNFVSASGEAIMFGGGGSPSGIANGHVRIYGNDVWKPPLWKITLNTAHWGGYNGTSYPPDPTVYCIYDETRDPDRPGGEWIYDGPADTWYQCGSDHLWHMVMTTPFHCDGSGFMAGTTTVCGGPSHKDALEIKSGFDIDYVANRVENSWADGQSGEAFNLSAENNGNMPGMRGDHIRLLSNAVYHVFQLSIRVNFCLDGSTTFQDCGGPGGWYQYENNLSVIDASACGYRSGSTTEVGCTAGGARSPQQIGGFVSGTSAANDVHVKNTSWLPDSDLQTGDSPGTFIGGSADCVNFSVGYNVRAFDNLMVGDPKGDCDGGNPNFTMQLYFNGAYLAYNIDKLGAGASYTSVGATNTFDKSTTAFPTSNTTGTCPVGYVNGTGLPDGDYHLDPTSCYSAANAMHTKLAHDNTDPGADIDKLNDLTGGVIAGMEGFSKTAHLKVEPYSTFAIASLTAPSSAACTFTVYSAAARNVSGNIVVSKMDTDTGSIHRGSYRQVLVTGLAAATHYWRDVKCGSQVMADEFTTPASGSGSYGTALRFATATPVRYSTDPGMATPTTLSAATLQPISVPTNSVVYVQEQHAGVWGRETMLGAR